MTAAILPFPTAQERDDAEFVRLGTSSYTRACAEGAVLWEACLHQSPTAELAGRVARLAADIERLCVQRQDTAGDFIALNDGGRIELQALPGALHAMMAGSRARAPSSDLGRLSLVEAAMRL